MALYLGNLTPEQHEQRREDERAKIVGYRDHEGCYTSYEQRPQEQIPDAYEEDSE